MGASPSLDLTGPSWEVAPRLLGSRLETRIGGEVTAVILTEVEAYDQSEPASHSHPGPTRRNASMFGPAGHFYVYRSYGIHWCINVVTGPAGHGAGVLLRGGVAVEGAAIMARRRGRLDHLSDGPGKLTQALAISGDLDGVAIDGGAEILLAPGEAAVDTIIATPRVGISRATDLPWRFVGILTSPFDPV